MMNWQDYITVDPSVCDGKACIKGTAERCGRAKASSWNIKDNRLFYWQNRPILSFEEDDGEIKIKLRKQG
jgi:hypothetical protein